jgi:hypothetical protein
MPRGGKKLPPPGAGEVTITLLPATAAQAAEQAAEAGLPLERWASEVVETFVATTRCRHVPPPPSASLDPRSPPRLHPSV